MNTVWRVAFTKPFADYQYSLWECVKLIFDIRRQASAQNSMLKTCGYINAFKKQCSE
uniref:Uncharacterized protein n=1 Tax=Anguilla anguilla TaxID=7936 RepID=A0A0E9W0S0_ANGAN